MNKIIIGIDPGTTESAVVTYDPESRLILGHYKAENATIEAALYNHDVKKYQLVIEQIEGYGMAVGKEVFETCYWSGRFAAAYDRACAGQEFAQRLPRRDIKLYLCGTARAKDKNIVVALVDRFDPDRKFGAYGKGTVKKPGPLYGFAADEWQALAIAIVHSERKAMELKWCAIEDLVSEYGEKSKARRLIQNLGA